MGIDLGNLAALRTFRVLRALKTVAIIPGKAYYPHDASHEHEMQSVPNEQIITHCNLHVRFRFENYRWCCHRICEESA